MNILLVCTGNICRSPLAEALMRREFASRNLAGFNVSSAGTGAWDGAQASEGAYLVGLENEIDLSVHRARLLTKELMEGADLILTMARHHRVRAVELGGDGKTSVLGEYVGLAGPDAEVSDPFGSGLEVYRKTFTELQQLISRAVDRTADEDAPNNGK